MDMKRRIVATQLTLVTLSESVMKEEKRALLKVHGGKEADQIWYWMGRNSPLSELTLDYTQRIGVSLNSVRFLHGGSAISPLLTADRLKLEDGALIDVIRWDKYKVSGGTQLTLISFPRANGELPICLKVEGIGKDSEQHYLIGRNTPLKNLLLDYADRTFQFYEHTRFYCGKISINPKKTGDHLEMSDGDIIHAVIKKCG